MKKRIACLIAVGLLAAMLIGCAAWQSKSDDAWQFTADSASAMEAAALYAAPEESAVPIPDPDAKIIYTADMDLETTGFDDAAAALSALTADCGGYYESSSLSNSGDRVARYTIRVPADRYREFISRAGEVCHLLEKHEHAEDVSEVYYDTAGRLETQQAKLARLRELLDQAENMEDIIALESAVSETEEQIDWRSGQLGRYDSLAPSPSERCAACPAYPTPPRAWAAGWATPSAGGWTASPTAWRPFFWRWLMAGSGWRWVPPP